MSAPRLLSVAVLLLAACAGWETSSPSYTPPPADGPTPSHYAPPPPGDPREPYTPPAPEQPRAGTVTVAIASVQSLQEDCPDPKPAAAPSPGAGGSAGAAIPVEQSMQKESSSARMRGDGNWTPPCQQSTVQLSVRADFVGTLKIEAVRVLDANSKKVAGSATLRGPMQWSNSVYGPWDERTVANTDLNISYKLGTPDFSRAAELVGPTFNTFGGPFMLELDVSVDGRRQTIRSSEFTREPPHVMVT